MLTCDGYAAQAVELIYSCNGQSPEELVSLGDLSHIEVARVNERCVLVVGIPEILERDVVNEPVTNIGPSPALEPSAVLAVQHPHVLDVNVPNKTLLTGVLADGAH